MEVYIDMCLCMSPSVNNTPAHRFLCTSSKSFLKLDLFHFLKGFTNGLW